MIGIGAKAAEYGIDTAAYYASDWHGTAFHRGTGPALTNYQALLNGKSIFEREELDAVIFDDAHTAHAVVRDQFTLRAARGGMPRTYQAVADAAGEYFRAVDRGRLLADVVERRDTASVLFVPMFVAAENAERFARALLDEGVEKNVSTLFAWEHIRDNLQNCAMFFDANGVEFAPPLPPVQDLRPFRGGVRRLYLSATLRVDHDFCRTFGRFPDRVIAPGGRAGETERMILPAPRALSDDDQHEWAKQVVGERKALVMVPQHGAADAWVGTAEVFNSEAGDDRIRQFAASADQKLVMVARYDGVDLPGEQCRIMVIDGLPVGSGLAERFHENHLRSRRISDGVIASRIVQMFGRISRGMQDYGVVLLLGHRLLRWLDSPRNRALLPVHIQQQLELGDLIAERYADLQPEAMLHRALGREAEWMETYTEHMAGTTAPAPEPEEDPAARKLALAERRFIDRLWEGDYREAARVLDGARSSAFAVDRRFGAWYLHWLGHALNQAGETERARNAFTGAAAVARELGRMPGREPHRAAAEAVADATQAAAMNRLLAERDERLLRMLRDARDALRPGSGASEPVREEAVRLIGEALGFQAIRPDKANDGEGPDVLWTTPNGERVFVIELKTGKESDHYSKDQVGQYHQHIQWTENAFPDAAQERLLVGPRVPCTRGSTPPAEVWVVAPEEMVRLAEELIALYEPSLSQRLDLFRAEDIQRELDERGLGWDELLEGLERIELATITG